MRNDGMGLIRSLSLFTASTATILRPTPEQLEGIDVLIYDIQDVGARCYTYISTLLYAMDAAYEAGGITFLVCDRPNPLGCLTVEGQVLNEEFRSFVGVHSIPMRYGLTIGELTSVLKNRARLPCHLHGEKYPNARVYARYEV